jgi:hypothetical protein
LANSGLDRGTLRRGFLLVGQLFAIAVSAGPLQAQDSIPAPADSAQLRDSVPPAARPDTIYPKAPVSPMGALLRSILVPGWGQAKLHRKLTGALFVTWEGVTLGMAIKTSHELQYLRRTGSGSIKAKEQEKQDWLVLLAFNHLFSGIEAYVSSHLWDFPDDLEISAAPLPQGGFGASIRVPIRLP